MLKYALLGAAMAMTAPALAQTATQAAPAGAMPAQTGATTAASQAAPAPAGPMQQAPATATAQPAADAAAQPAAEPAQVAQVVDTEFTTYDKNTDGKLSQVEFGAWMVALKSQTDPATDANSAATKKWNQAAFAQADKDKSKSLSKDEVTGFLASASKS